MTHPQKNKRVAGIGAGGWAVAVVVMLAASSGCETQSFFDPTEMGRYDKTPLVKSLLKNLETGIEEPDDRFANATEVRPEDLVAVPRDYVIGRNDLIQVSIADLVQQNVETVKTMRVSESGFISLPLIPPVKAVGLTEAQLEQAIAQAYQDANVISRAQVSVVTVEARSRIFSISDGVAQPGSYVIVDSNFRLLDALVMARGVVNPEAIENIYVIRRVEHDLKEMPKETPGEAAPPAQPGPGVLEPQSRASWHRPAMMSEMSPAEPPTTAPAGSAEGRIIVVEDKPLQIEGGQTVPATTPPPQQPEAQVQAEVPATKQFEFESPQEPSDVRIIRVPYDALRRGELKYNIVIRPLDMIIVPPPVVGEYYMGGHVARVGVYSLTGRKITLKQAVVAAGMLDQLAIPSRTQIVRRIGDKEVFARVDLAKIFAGEQPDIILKPNDVVTVGTNAIAPFLASFRGGFRLTYGFGFLYDRNYWDANNP